MKKTNTILLIFILSAFAYNASAQFVVANDTIRGSIDFCPRLGDLKNAINVPNDSVFYMFPITPGTDPWRYADYYTPSRTTQNGYLQSSLIMRVEDYDIIEVERLSAHGYVSFKSDKVRARVDVAKITSKDTSIKNSSSGYTVNGKEAKGAGKWRSPQLRYQSISVTIKGKTITFPKKFYEHLLEPEIDNMAIYYNEKKDIVYVIANNGGTDNYYQAMWQVSPRGVANVYIFDPTKK
ncbi:hypothetical protein [Prevotella sp. 10(H)]|uniref:hypothetical protein n=1 Tax=Prevotella sp. 10(H) TaxID=1158294 RepID=UPI0004A741FB|nr:hypothetical protein [Prevotella sp. 10(H)]